MATCVMKWCKVRVAGTNCLHQFKSIHTKPHRMLFIISVEKVNHLSLFRFQVISPDGTNRLAEIKLTLWPWPLTFCFKMFIVYGAPGVSYFYQNNVKFVWPFFFGICGPFRVSAVRVLANLTVDLLTSSALYQLFAIRVTFASIWA